MVHVGSALEVWAIETSMCDLHRSLRSTDTVNRVMRESTLLAAERLSAGARSPVDLIGPPDVLPLT